MHSYCCSEVEVEGELQELSDDRFGLLSWVVQLAMRG